MMTDINAYFQELRAAPIEAVQGENQNTILQIEMLSPTHIGTRSTEHWFKDVDYFYRDGFLYEVDKKVLVQQLRQGKNQFYDYVRLINDKDNWKNPVDRYVRLFHNYQLNEAIVLDKMAQVHLPYSDEIRRMIHDTTGRVVLPGTAIKGALRTILFQHFYRQPAHGRKESWKTIEERLFGPITNNLMRLLRVTDTALEQEQITYHSTKVLSRDKDKAPVWKYSNESGDHGKPLKPQKFGTAYECFATGAAAAFRFGLQDAKGTLASLHQQIQAIEQQLKKEQKKEQKKRFKQTVKDYQQLITRIEHLLEADHPIQMLFHWANQLIIEYVEAEIAFYEYQLSEGNKETQTMLQELVEWLKTTVLEPARAAGKKPEYCILRLGQGVGFHSITGDWQYPQQHIKEVTKRGKDKETQQYSSYQVLQYKTRKLTLQKIKEGYQVRPFGYVKLHLPTSWQQQKTTFENPQRAFLRPSAASLVAEPFKGPFKQGQTLDATLVRETRDKQTRKMMKVFEYQIQGREGKLEAWIDYKGALEVGQIYILEIRDVNKKKKQINKTRFLRKKT